jgi:hypothetical protein
MKTNEEYTPIDFTVYFGKRRGMSINLVPGFVFPDSSRAIGMDDRAFYLVEYYFPKDWVSSSEYDHFGVSTFPRTIWISITEKLNILYRLLLSVDAKEELWRITNRYNELEVDRNYDAPSFEGKVVEFLRELIVAIDLWNQEFDKVYFYGL